MNEHKTDRYKQKWIDRNRVRIYIYIFEYFDVENVNICVRFIIYYLLLLFISL